MLSFNESLAPPLPAADATALLCAGLEATSTPALLLDGAERVVYVTAAAALLLGGMRAGAPAMQINAKIPIEIIDVIQGLILLFLAAEVVVRKLIRSRGETVTPSEIETVSRSYGETIA